MCHSPGDHLCIWLKKIPTCWRGPRLKWALFDERNILHFTFFIFHFTFWQYFSTSSLSAMAVASNWIARECTRLFKFRQGVYLCTWRGEKEGEALADSLCLKFSVSEVTRVKLTQPLSAAPVACWTSRLFFFFSVTSISVCSYCNVVSGPQPHT